MKHNTSLFVNDQRQFSNYGPPTYDEWLAEQNSNLPTNTNRFDWGGLIRTALDTLSVYLDKNNPQQPAPQPAPQPTQTGDQLSTYLPYIFIGAVLLVGFVIVKKLV
jgi:hypothetical protein